MRTNELQQFSSNISAINNHFSHASFVFEQFRLDSAGKLDKKPDILTTKTFTENKYVDQFNVRLGNLEQQTIQTKNFLTDSLFVFANTHFEVYLKAIFVFYKTVTDEKLGEVPETSIYENVLKKLRIDPDQDIDNLLVSTFEYLKLRRNAIMHRDRKHYFQTSLYDLIKGKFGNSKHSHKFRANQLNGPELNAAWKKYREELTGRGYVIRALNFTDTKHPDFSFEELCDVLNFYRLFAAAIDRLILERLGRLLLIKYCKSIHRAKYNCLEEDFSDENPRKKLKRTCIFELGFEPTDVEIEPEKIGA